MLLAILHEKERGVFGFMRKAFFSGGEAFAKNYVQPGERKGRPRRKKKKGLSLYRINWGGGRPVSSWGLSPSPERLGKFQLRGGGKGYLFFHGDIYLSLGRGGDVINDTLFSMGGR